MRHPPAGQVWIHVDRLDREDGRVWAVQDRDEDGRPRYRTVYNVVWQTACYTQFFGATGKQPKAVIVVPGGRCEVRDGIAVVSAGGS